MDKKRIVAFVDAGVGFLALLIYLSMHTMLGFIGYFTFVALPYLLGVFLLLTAVTALLLAFWKNNFVLLIVTFVYNGLMFLFSTGYFFALLTHYKGFLIEGGKIFALYLFVAIVVYLCFFHGKTEFKGKRIVAIVLCAAMVLTAVLGFTDFRSLRINYLDGEAAVYAVGEDYQIVWTTAAQGAGWVEIGGKTYYDEYAGQMRTTDKAHKVTVPQTVLDEAKGYTVCSKAILSEQGFSGLFGYEVKKSYSFRPVDETDGIQAYAVADSHDHNGVAAKTAQYFGDKTDFVVLGGDAVNYLDTEQNLAEILSLAHRCTGGNIPCVFARGNHELKCDGSERLHRYVGSDGESFYFTFRLKNVWGVVLDMGEDHADDWKEFYGSAIYADYRARQADFLDGLIENKEQEYAAPGVDYRIGICHVSTAFAEYDRDYNFEDLVAVNERLNQMDLDVMLSGHLHEVFKVEGNYPVGKPLSYTASYGKNSANPSYIATGAKYPSILVSRRSYTQNVGVKEYALGQEFIGTAIEFFGEEKTAKFTTKKKEVLFSISPFEEIDYGKVIVL